jgi:TM2 domain-containing membrane protein YozV
MPSKVTDCNTTIYCAACGNPVIATAFVCPKCGTKIVRPNVPKDERKTAHETRERVVYIVLALLFGVVGVHNFYAGRHTPAVIQLIIGITIVGQLITFPWAMIDAIVIRKDGNGIPFV